MFPPWPAPGFGLIVIVRCMSSERGFSGRLGGMSPDSPSSAERSRANELRRRHYAAEAQKYDREMDFWERWLFGAEHRAWACSQATGDTLEVAIGTGLNLRNYPAAVSLTGIDLSPEMLVVAKTRAEKLSV